MSRLYPAYPIAAVGAVLIDNDEILLVRRAYPPGKGKWSIPGGAMERGERIGEAAKRELKEETGIEAEPTGILWVLNNIVLDERGDVKYHYLILDVLFDPKSIKGSLRPGGDVVDVAWISLRSAVNAADVSRTVKKLINRILKYGLTTLPLEDVDNIVHEQ
ncbi:MAG: NUDIX hydrolase [Desulfurococcaceae archaeon]